VASVARSEYRICVIYTKCKQLIIEIGCGVLVLIGQTGTSSLKH